MRRAIRTRISTVLLLSVGVAVPSGARAANDQCFAASTQGQQLALDKKWRAAREKFAACAAPSCPSEVAEDCKARLAMSEASIGSIVVSVLDGAGKNITEGRVIVDGETVAGSLDGNPIAVDPGTHRVHVESPAAAPFDRDVVVAEGAKRVAVVFTVPAPDAGPTPDAPTPTSSSSKTPTSVYVVGGIGVVGLACFVGFGIAALSQSSDLHARDPGTYTTDDVDSLKRKRLIADVSLGVGVVALGIATVIYATRPTEPQADVAIDVRPVAGGAIATWGGVF